MKQRCVIDVKGKNKSWSFDTKVDTKYLDEWRADGLQIFVLHNRVPQWAVAMGLLRPWCFVQDAWNRIRLW